MKRFYVGPIVIFLLLLLTVPARAADPPPDVASYRIEVTYGTGSHVLSGQETLTYVNRTETPMPDLVFHLYLNAFRNEETLWMREARASGGAALRGYAYDPDAPGWMRVDAIRLADGRPLALEPLDRDETLVRARLPRPVAPGEAVTVTLDFAAQLPYIFARTGWADEGNFVMAGQWFPKAGVWEGERGWNAYPFHANSEFFADFGHYDVRISLPEGWVIAATGVESEPPKRQAEGWLLHHLTAEHVIDFAWGASPKLVSETRALVDGVELRTYFYPGQRQEARRAMEAVERGYPLYESWYAPYGMGLYDALTMLIVPPDAGGAGGMEYPKLFTVGALGGSATPSCLHLVEIEALHELGHQWFQAMVATNEAEAPWMDEGMTDFSAARAVEALYDGSFLDCGGWRFTYLESRRLEYTMFPTTPMSGTAWELGEQYAVATYSKPVIVFTTLERIVGEDALNELFHRYVERYAFTHPDAAAFLGVMEETLGPERTAWFRQVLETGATMDFRVAELSPGEVVIERDGELCLPLPITVEEGDEVIEKRWDCNDASSTMRIAGEHLRAAAVDPAQTAVIDLNLANNALRLHADRKLIASIWTLLVHTVQLIFAVGSGIW